MIFNTVDVGVVDKLLMQEIDLLLGNDLVGNNLWRPYQNNQEACGKSKFHPRNETEMNVATELVTCTKVKEWEKENLGKKNNEKQGKKMRKNSMDKRDLIRNPREHTEQEEYFRMAEYEYKESFSKYPLWNGILMRKWKPQEIPDEEDWATCKPVLPKKYRSVI